MTFAAIFSGLVSAIRSAHLTMPVSPASGGPAGPTPGPGIIRRLSRRDAGLHRAHLLRLDPESRRSRFMGVVSDDYVRSYAAEWNSADRVIYGLFVDDVLRGAAELRATGANSAEIAFSIEKPWQGHGVGAALFERVLLAARNRGWRRLHMACLGDNRAMQQLAAKFDTHLSFEAGTALGELTAWRATPVSLMREAIADLSDLVFALLERTWRVGARLVPDLNSAAPAM